MQNLVCMGYFRFFFQTHCIQLINYWFFTNICYEHNNKNKIIFIVFTCMVLCLWMTKLSVVNMHSLLSATVLYVFDVVRILFVFILFLTLLFQCLTREIIVRKSIVSRRRRKKIINSSWQPFAFLIFLVNNSYYTFFK